MGLPTFILAAAAVMTGVLCSGGARAGERGAQGGKRPAVRAETKIVSFGWVKHTRNYLAQFVEPGMPLQGDAIIIAGARYPFTVATDGKSISIAAEPDGAPSRTVGSGKTFDLRIPLSLAEALAAPKPPEAKGYSLSVEKDALGVWRVHPITVARVKVKNFTITISDMNLNGIYGEPWQDGIVVDPALPPWPKGDNRSKARFAGPPYLIKGKGKWPASYGFPDTGPVKPGSFENPWLWHYVVPFRKRFPVEEYVFELSPGEAPGSTKLALDPFVPQWPEDRRRFLIALNRMRLSIGLPSAFGSDKAGANPGANPLLAETAITDLDYTYLPANDRNYRPCYLDPRTRSFCVDLTDVPLRRGQPPLPTFTVDGSDLDPEAVWPNWPVLWPPPECDRYPWCRMNRGIDWDDDAHTVADKSIPPEIRTGAAGTDSGKDSGPAITLTFAERDPRISNLIVRMWEVPGGPAAAKAGPSRLEQEIVLWCFSPSSDSKKRQYRPGQDNGKATHLRNGSNNTIHAIPNHRLKPWATFRIYVLFDWRGGNWEKSWWVQTGPSGLFPGYKEMKD